MQDDSFIPYGRQSIDEQDIAAVVSVLRSKVITTGPAIASFEKRMSNYIGAQYTVAVCNGTAALHTALFAAGIGKQDEVIVPSMTFAATANAVLYCGGTPVFADVKSSTLLIDPLMVEQIITSKTKAIIAVDYAGQPCDYTKLRRIADKHNLILISDACHALGASYQDQKVGTLADITAFSFHPVKHITSGEGGMISTNNPHYNLRMRQFRNHGINIDHQQRTESNAWFYQMDFLGYNYRITDFQCALGESQLSKLDPWIQKRRDIASQYDTAFENHNAITTLKAHSDRRHAYHLYVVKFSNSINRDDVFKLLREKKIGVNVHYIPVHLHPYYKNIQGTKEGMCPVAEAAYRSILSLPMFPELSKSDLQFVIKEVKSAITVVQGKNQ
ncbi:MAG: UDP-4-amino-4,6-dideoxy-N-acetyl-beta-L-altrosamine transaminase [Fibrobacteria bacterium]|nr:UDP-4-amino-4,6-dideoxy-N-acetyl-beta-L-altrosamine transaminase [Fibrobacteria bacterium]